MDLLGAHQPIRDCTCVYGVGEYPTPGQLYDGYYYRMLIGARVAVVSGLVQIE